MAFDLINTRNIQVQRIYKWLITINDIDFDGRLVEGVTFPTSEPGKDAFHLGGGDIYLPSFSSTGSVSIDFIEDEEGSISKMLQAWRREVVAKDGTFGYPGSSNSTSSVGFKKNGLLLLLNTRNESHTEIKLDRMFPTSQAPVRLTYAESNKVVISQEFSVDEIDII